MSSSVILWVQLCCSLICTIFSICICISMSLHQDQFKGHCLLFSSGQWRLDGDAQFMADWASQAYCNFTIFVAVITFVLSGSQLYHFCHLIRRNQEASFFSAFIDILVASFVSLMVLIAALFITFGFHAWCSAMNVRFESCQQATKYDIDRIDGIDSSGFYIQMFTSQFGCWISFSASWCLMIFSILKLARFQTQSNMRVLKARNRNSLLNDDLIATSSQTKDPDCTLKTSGTSKLYQVEEQTEEDAITDQSAFIRADILFKKASENIMKHEKEKERASQEIKENDSVGSNKSDQIEASAAVLQQILNEEEH